MLLAHAGITKVKQDSPSKMNVGIKCKLDRLEEMFLEVDYIPGQQPPSYEELEKEFLRIKRELIQDVLSFKKEPQLQRYVRYHQQAMVKLMDQVLELGTPAVRFKKLQYEMCYERLDELLEFVQYNFSEYFDWDAYVLTFVPKEILTNTLPHVCWES